MDSRDHVRFYALIRRLTTSQIDFLCQHKGERKSFRLLANYYSPNKKNHIFLFDLIAKMDHYDSVYLQQKLTEAEIKTPLGALSTYLQEQILKSLRFSESDKTVDDRIINLLTNAKILHHKGLEKQSRSNMQKAKKLAIENEKFTLLLEIQNIEWFYLYDFDPKDISEFGGTLNILNNLYRYRNASYEKNRLLWKGEIRDHELKAEWDKLISSDVFDPDTKPKHYEEQYHYFQIPMRYYFRNNIFEKSLYYQHQAIAHLESDPELLSSYKETYMFELNGMIGAFCQNHKNDLAAETLTKLLNFSVGELTQSEFVRKVDTCLVAYANLIFSYLRDNEIQKATLLSIEAKKFLASNPATEAHKAFLYLNFAKISIYNGDFNEALKWNNKIRNAEIKQRDDFNTWSKLFNLIIHFELRNFELVKSITHSTAVHLEKRKQLYKTEAIILKYLKTRFSKVSTTGETMQLLKLMREELAALRDDPYEAKAYDYFDYISWLDSKITRRSLIDIAAERSRA